MKQDIKKMEKKCDSIIQGIYESIVFPKLIKAAKKIGLTKIEECNNYYFFTFGEKTYIEREFIELSKKNEDFYKVYITPLENSRYQFPKNLELIF